MQPKRVVVGAGNGSLVSPTSGPTKPVPTVLTSSDRFLSERPPTVLASRMTDPHELAVARLYPIGAPWGALGRSAAHRTPRPRTPGATTRTACGYACRGEDWMYVAGWGGIGMT